MIVNTYTPELNDSRFIAAHVPLVFKYFRKDEIYVSVAPYTGSLDGDIEITTTNNIDSLVTVGDMIYVSELNKSYEVVYKSGTTILATGDTITATYTNGFINFTTARANYYVDIDLQDENGVSLITDYISYRPAPTGEIVVNLSIFLKSFFDNTINLDYSDINVIEALYSKLFNLKIREVYNSVAQSWSALLTNDYIAVNGCKQVGENANMSEYVMFPTTEASPDYSTGKFMTKFDVPIYNNGYPFSLSFLFSQELSDAANYLKIGIKLLDINGTVLAVDSAALNDLPNYVNNVRINGSYSAYKKLKAFLLNSAIAGYYQRYLINTTLKANVSQYDYMFNNNGLVVADYTKLLSGNYLMQQGEFVVVDIEITSDTCGEGLSRMLLGANRYDTSGTLIGTIASEEYINCSISILQSPIYYINGLYATRFIIDSRGNNTADIPYNQIAAIPNAGTITPKNILRDLYQDIRGYVGTYMDKTVILTSGAYYILGINGTITKSDGITANNVFAFLTNELYTNPDTGNPDNIKFNIYFCGNSGKIYKAVSDAYYSYLNDNAYTNFTVAEVTHGLTTANLKRIIFLDENEGYAFGDNFTILKTVDGGTTWELLRTTAPSGYSTTCNDAMIAGGVFYFKVQNTATSQYDIISLDAIDEFEETEIISEEKEILINDCFDNPVYLRWLNDLGGIDYFMFQNMQMITDDVDQEISYNKSFDLLHETTGRVKVLSKKSNENIQVGAENLTREQIEGLRSLLSSPEVQYYVNNSWVDVRIKTGSFNIFDTSENKANIQMTVVMPEKYIQS